MHQGWVRSDSHSRGSLPGPHHPRHLKQCFGIRLASSRTLVNWSQVCAATESLACACPLHTLGCAGGSLHWAFGMVTRRAPKGVVPPGHLQVPTGFIGYQPSHKVAGTDAPTTLHHWVSACPGIFWG